MFNSTCGTKWYQTMSVQKTIFVQSGTMEAMHRKWMLLGFGTEVSGSVATFFTSQKQKDFVEFSHIPCTIPCTNTKHSLNCLVTAKLRVDSSFWTPVEGYQRNQLSEYFHWQASGHRMTTVGTQSSVEENSGTHDGMGDQSCRSAYLASGAWVDKSTLAFDPKENLAWNCQFSLAKVWQVEALFWILNDETDFQRNINRIWFGALSASRTEPCQKLMTSNDAIKCLNWDLHP